MDGRHLSQLLDEAARRRPEQTAVEDEHGQRQSYAELLHGADRVATRLARWGVDRGDRVGLWLPKSLEAVTAIHGVLRTGASYVPVDATGPAARAAGILAASGVKAAIVAAELVPALHAAWTGSGPPPRLIVVDGLLGPVPTAVPAYRATPALRYRCGRCRLVRGDRRLCTVAALCRPARRMTWRTSCSRRARPASPKA